MAGAALSGADFGSVPAYQQHGYRSRFFLSTVRQQQRRVGVEQAVKGGHAGSFCFRYEFRCATDGGEGGAARMTERGEGEEYAPLVEHRLGRTGLVAKL